MDDSSDILGGQLHIAKHDAYHLLPNVAFSDQLLVLGAVVVLVFSLQHLYPTYKQYQERRYRKYVAKNSSIELKS